MTASVERNPVWAELVQLVPVVSLALPFIVQGEVDLAAAAPGFYLAAALTIPAHGAVLARGHLQNPIAVGTALWLWFGALAFGADVRALTGWLAQTQAFGLFVCVFAVGAITTAASPTGFVGCRSSEPGWVRTASLGLLAFAALVLSWAWWFHADVRLGGGLPFIVLNVVRRVLTLRAPR